MTKPKNPKPIPQKRRGVQNKSKSIAPEASSRGGGGTGGGETTSRSLSTALVHRRGIVERVCCQSAEPLQALIGDDGIVGAGLPATSRSLLTYWRVQE